MNMLWQAESEMKTRKTTMLGWLLGALRVAVLMSLLIFGMVILLVFRIIERPFFGLRRPVTPFITQFVCRRALAIMGIGLSMRGERMKEMGAVVANHSSWLDIFVLNAKKRVYFVSKSEVAQWPGIGWLAKATGTVFIRRNPRDAKHQQQLFEARLLVGHKLLFFPEGTSTDSLRVLPFKSTLFQAFFNPHLHHKMFIQPVTVIYFAPPNQDSRFYGWWGDMEFGAHLVKTLTTVRQGRVEIVYHAPVKVDQFANRKVLAAHVESIVRSGMPVERQQT
ncbi:MAG: 1-acyl-sn-glycerol-3-phosphate acyltransferase [Rhodobacterales bacterium]|nr:1-acyl-sn-glycerol-3-phosphate acyltransferase [Rhodobacterales bacterium]